MQNFRHSFFGNSKQTAKETIPKINTQATSLTYFLNNLDELLSTKQSLNTVFKILIDTVKNESKYLIGIITRASGLKYSDIDTFELKAPKKTINHLITYCREKQDKHFQYDNVRNTKRYDTITEFNVSKKDEELDTFIKILEKINAYMKTLQQETKNNNANNIFNEKIIPRIKTHSSTISIGSYRPGNS